MKKAPRPKHAWRIGVFTTKRFWCCLIFKTTDDLNAWQSTFGGHDGWADRRARNREYAALVLTLKNMPVKRCEGYLLFALNHFGGGIVAHEMVHAGLRTRRLGFGQRLSRNDEELLAQTVEHLTREFWNKWFRYAEKAK